MLIVHGTYHFGRKRIGYRNDYCLKCDAERISEQYRMFDMGHVFWIPLIPLGVRRRWYCATCRNDPHHRVKTSRRIKILAAILFGMMSLAMWVTPSPPDEAGDVWSGRIVMTLIFVVLLMVALRDKGEGQTNLKEKLGSLSPITEQTCLYCQGPLLPELVTQSKGKSLHQQTWNCRACGVRRY